MLTILGKPVAALAAQLMLGLVNGCFYAMLSLGLAVIFGLLRVINFSHGAMYMLGAMGAWWAAQTLGIGYWGALLAVPLIVGVLGLAFERWLLQRLRGLDPLYGLLLTFGLTLVLEGLLRSFYGTSGQPYPVPEALTGSLQVGPLALPVYRVWVVAVSMTVCLATWAIIERTPLGATLRACTENPRLTQAFGINVPRVVAITFGVGIGLAALAGVLAAPMTQVQPLMGSNLIIVVFAVVVIGGMGSLGGAIVSGVALGLIEGLTKVFYAAASSTVVFVLMVLVLLIRPAGLFGREH
jgi:branched-chain amino acid transport system permease protein